MKTLSEWLNEGCKRFCGDSEYTSRHNPQITKRIECNSGLRMANKITSEEMDELLFSLAWCSWSAYHSENAKSLLKGHFPELDTEKQIKRFKNIITQKPQEGSPK